MFYPIVKCITLFLNNTPVWKGVFFPFLNTQLWYNKFCKTMFILQIHQYIAWGLILFSIHETELFFIKSQDSHWYHLHALSFKNNPYWWQTFAHILLRWHSAMHAMSPLNLCQNCNQLVLIVSSSCLWTNVFGISWKYCAPSALERTKNSVLNLHAVIEYMIKSYIQRLFWYRHFIINDHVQAITEWWYWCSIHLLLQYHTDHKKKYLYSYQYHLGQK